MACCLHNRQVATQKVVIPCVASLLQDPESVIRQHVAAQLLPIAITCMISRASHKVQAYVENPDLPKEYHEAGYRVVVDTVLEYLNELISDPELEVRRSAADALCGISLLLRPDDVPKHCIEVPLQLAMEKPKNSGSAKNKRTEEEQRQEELRITAANLLAEMGGAASEHKGRPLAWVRGQVLPAILDLAEDPSFRVRRAAAQALPRLLGACTLQDAVDKILPMFGRLSQDDIHRVRKSTGECLVDMSRALMIMAAAHPSIRDDLYKQRRKVLLPIAERLIQDSHKMVRQGMMQFLGPFIASFYPYVCAPKTSLPFSQKCNRYQFSELHGLLPTDTESDGSNHLGIVAQFFPHATSMVSRLNSSQNATQTAPTPVHASLEELSPKMQLELLPSFVTASRISTLSLHAVTLHRRRNPPDPEDIEAVVDTLLDYFVALAAVQTGDENTDAEMRVYCAYSFPAVVLLLGPDHWEGAVRTCFHTLLNPRYPEDPPSSDDEDDCEPPLPVKRCLASSLHTVAHILGSDIDDIVGIVRTSFLTDPDDSVRLSTLRNFPAVLKLLSPKQRRAPFLQWAEVVVSEDVLGFKKRSATNPTVLNWRQRDYLARSLPDLIPLMDPVLVHKHIWPILKLLLTDAINIVRDNAIWSIPILLKMYCVENLSKWPHISSHAKKFNAEASAEVVVWVKDTILRTKGKKMNNFSDRQLYCRLCTAFGLALRFGEGQDPVSVLTDKFRTFVESDDPDVEQGPYQKLTAAEMKLLKKILTEELLPTALEMKEDRISNVRITLMKGLQLMPPDVQSIPSVQSVLKELEEESETWTSFGEEDLPLATQQQQLREQQQQLQLQQQMQLKTSSSGPIDVDSMNSSSHQSKSSPDAMRGKSPPRNDNLKTVVFEQGSIGMQLEPTADDAGCRVVGFTEDAPASQSGQILVGDVIVRINNERISSYDAGIAILKAGGRRKITFRPGVPEDVGEEDGSVASDDSEQQRLAAQQKKEPKKPKRDKPKKEKKEAKKDSKKPKKEKKAKKEKK